MDLFFEKSQCASKRSLGHIFNEASKNKNTDPASALRLRKILGGKRRILDTSGEGAFTPIL